MCRQTATGVRPTGEPLLTRKGQELLRWHATGLALCELKLQMHQPYNDSSVLP